MLAASPFRHYTGLCRHLPFRLIGIILPDHPAQIGISIPRRTGTAPKTGSHPFQQACLYAFQPGEPSNDWQTLRVLIDMCKEPIVISRMYHRGQVITLHRKR